MSPGVVCKISPGGGGWCKQNHCFVQKIQNPWVWFLSKFFKCIFSKVQERPSNEWDVTWLYLQTHVSGCTWVFGTYSELMQSDLCKWYRVCCCVRVYKGEPGMDSRHAQDLFSLCLCIDNQTILGQYGSKESFLPQYHPTTEILITAEISK